MPPGRVAVSIPLVGQDSSLVVRRTTDDTLEILFHALTQCQRWHRLATFTFMAATQVHLAQTNHVALATGHPAYPTPSSATPNWVRLACMICYDLLRFPGFLKLSRPILFSRKILMGNDLDRKWPDLASPPSSWRNSKRIKALWCYCPSSSCFPKAAQTGYILLHVGYVSCYVLLRVLLHICYISATCCRLQSVQATFCHQGMGLARVRSLDDGLARTASCKISPG